MMSRIDTFIGKKMFLPLIIKILQISGETQYSFARSCNFIAILAFLYACIKDVQKDAGIINILWFIFLAFAALYSFVDAVGANKDNPKRPSSTARKISIFIIALDFVGVFLTLASGEDPSITGVAMIVGWLIFLAGDYALLIDKIPPSTSKRKSYSRKTVRAEKRG